MLNISLVTGEIYFNKKPMEGSVSPVQALSQNRELENLTIVYANNSAATTATAGRKVISMFASACPRPDKLDSFKICSMNCSSSFLLVLFVVLMIISRLK